MDSVLVESPTLPKSPGFGTLTGPSFEIMLNESVDRFLREMQREEKDLSGFRSIFFRLLQSRADPPLEIIWFYSAVSYHENLFLKKEILDRFIAVKELFQLLVACSSSCNGSKSIALVAPALSELYRVIVEVEKSKEKLSAKAVKKLRREIDSLVEGILGYISICSTKSYRKEDNFTTLTPCFVDLVRVWTVQEFDGREGLGLLFPLISDKDRDELGREGCEIGYLSGVVTAEAFLLRLLLKLKGEVSRQELQNELRVWAVGSITGFRNYDFFEILLKLLLEQTLSATFLLCSKEESFLWEILRDSVILVEYSFLIPGTDVEKSDDRMKSIALTWLVVTHEAIQAARVNGDQSKAISYVNAFSRSHLRSALIKWVISQIGMDKVSRPNAATPQVLLKWLLYLEKQGHIVLEHDVSTVLTKSLMDELKDSKDPMIEADREETEELFFFDKKGEDAEDSAKDQEMESMDDVFLSAAHKMNSQEQNGRRKRKGRRGNEGDAQVKFVKYKLHDPSAKEYFLTTRGDGMSSGSEVENPPSDEDMEETEE